jgi:hypothetical protein
MVAAGFPGEKQSSAMCVDDLTMGELERIIEQPANWNAVNIRYDRATFCKELAAVRELRNELIALPRHPGCKGIQTPQGLCRGRPARIPLGEQLIGTAFSR